MFFVARVGLLSLLFASVDAEDWSSLRARADRLCQAGNYQAALKTYKIAFAEVDPADAPRLATTLSDLGRTHRLLGDYREAKSAFARALRIFETDASTPVLQLAIACNNLAVLEMTS
jgi:tetratricopeptide (TPR) repeat protein